MYSEASITALIPTYYRPVGLRKVLQSLRMTSDINIMVATEPDDKQARAIAEDFGAGFSICKGKALGCAHAWNTALENAPNSDIYVIGADDCIFEEFWLDAALIALEKIGDGLVGFNSGRRKEFSDHYLMTRNFIIDHHGGVAAVPHYTSWGVDDEAQERAKQVNKLIRANDAHVLHDKSRFDDGYKMGIQRRAWNKSLYAERKLLGFPDDFPPIIKP